MPTWPASGSPSTAAPSASSRWTPTGPTIPTATPSLLAPLLAGTADLVIGSRYTPGGQVVDWGIFRRVVSRGGSLFARIVLGLPANDLTGGFKAWRAATLAGVDFAGVHAGGYVFQVEMTYRAQRGGARIREVPITFRDRRVGQSKMSRRIIVEALVVVLQLRWDELRGRGPRRARMRLGETASAPAAVPGVRVLVDVRPLGDPERAPATATYLRGLLGAYAAEPLAGESFVFLLDLGADDPADLFPGTPRGW